MALVSASARPRWLVFVYVLFACAVASLAVLVAAAGRPSIGMSGTEGGVVTDVFPGSPAWNSGIRVGQPLIGIDTGERPEEWRVTVDQGEITTIGAALWTDQLRSTLPIALTSGIAAVLGVLALGLSRATAIAVSTAALLVAEAPLMAQGDRVISTAIGAAALAAPAIWMAARLGFRRPLVVLSAAAVGLALAWVGSRFAWHAQFQSLEAVRVGLTWGSLLILVVMTGWADIWPITSAYDRRRRTDALVLALVVVSAATVIYAGHAPVPTLLVAALVVVSYPMMRGRVLTMADTIAFGTVRERAALDAAEDERRRVAREIHDTAIQDLAALASRLEREPGLEGVNAADEVRWVAERLRDITSRLASAELEDLGLGSALSGLVARNDQPGEMRVRLALVDDTATADHPIPEDVAVAAYRIAQEAVRNAQRHSGATEVLIKASLSPDAIDLEVADDGVGVDRVAIASARKRGHIGLASMRQRAAAIDGDLSITGSDTGTRVALAWHR